MPAHSYYKKASSAIQLVLPSRYGYERIAMEAAATMAEIMGFPRQRIDDLRTAVSEACINAMEHGNKLRTIHRVEVMLVPGRRALKVHVHDRGGGFKVSDKREPDIAKKLAGEESPRGWGLFLIRRLVDRVDFKSRPATGHVTTLTMKLSK
jgi:serine/threonine-protein kinase RsbW